MPQAEGLAGHLARPVDIVQRVGGRRRVRHSDVRRTDHDAAQDGHQQRDAAADVSASHVAYAPPAAATRAADDVRFFVGRRRSHRVVHPCCGSTQRVVWVHATGFGSQFTGFHGAAPIVRRVQHGAGPAGEPQGQYDAGEFRHERF